MTTASRSQLSTYTSSSAWYQSTLEGSGIRNETLRDRMSQLKEWLYNSEEGILMGRHILDWVFLGIGYFLLGLALFGMSAAFCGLFFWAVDWNAPTLQGPSSILQVPGLAIRPQVYPESTLVRFFKNMPETFNHHIDHIEAYIQFYENTLQQGDSFMDCTSIQGRRPEEDIDKACVFDVLNLGDGCTKQLTYGYSDGQPCVLLKLNKIFDWVPEEYTPDTVPEEIKDVWTDPMSFLVKCDGDDPVTRENMGDLEYYPTNGFHFKYFPFRNQQGYRSPLLFLKFMNPTPGIMLMMNCKAYARNIVHDRVQRMGEIRFQMLMD